MLDMRLDNLLSSMRELFYRAKSYFCQNPAYKRQITDFILFLMNAWAETYDLAEKRLPSCAEKYSAIHAEIRGQQWMEQETP